MPCIYLNKIISNNLGLDEDKLSYAKADAVVMDPGPIIRGVQIESKIADGNRSLILQQVENGVACAQPF